MPCLSRALPMARTSCRARLIRTKRARIPSSLTPKSRRASRQALEIEATWIEIADEQHEEPLSGPTVGVPQQRRVEETARRRFDEDGADRWSAGVAEGARNR